MRCGVALLGGLLVAASPAWSGDISIDGQLVSTASSGAPLTVTSDEKVANLNADLLDGLDSTQLATQLQVDSVYHRAYFTADDTFVVPTGVTLLSVTVIGGGGGGGGGAIASELGGGGGGSGFVVTTVLEVSPGSSLTLDLGAGGTGGSAGSPGSDGEPTVLSFPSGRVVAPGGEKGLEGDVIGEGGDGFWGGGGGAFAGGGLGLFLDGGPGGFPAAGDGASGGPGGLGAGLGTGGGGGGGPGGGAGGAGGDSAAESGDPGSQPGAGGGGGGGADSLAGEAGGDGAGGAVLVTWVGAPLGS